MSSARKRRTLFDQWAQTYDVDVYGEVTFPFIGYEDVISTMTAFADIQSIHTILDLGIGTGNLARQLSLADERIWGVDFSAAMLEKARAALPGAHLIQVDLTGDDWLEELEQPFDRILSAYTFHEFTDEHKIALLSALANGCLKPDGWIVIGDISFETKARFNWAQQHFSDLWDEDEHYWCAEPVTNALIETGFSVEYHQVSICAGVYRIWPDDGLTQP